MNQNSQDPADKAFLESLQSTMRDVKREMSEEGERKEADYEELQDRVIGRHMEDLFQWRGLRRLYGIGIGISDGPA